MAARYVTFNPWWTPERPCPQCATLADALLSPHALNASGSAHKAPRTLAAKNNRERVRHADGD